jgi:hypothetical protein
MPVPAKGVIAIGQFAFGVFTLSQFGIGVVSISQFTVAAYALAQFAFAYSLIAQIGIYIYEGHGQLVMSLSELIGMLWPGLWSGPADAGRTMLQPSSRSIYIVQSKNVAKAICCVQRHGKSRGEKELSHHFFLNEWLILPPPETTSNRRRRRSLKSDRRMLSRAACCLRLILSTGCAGLSSITVKQIDMLPSGDQAAVKVRIDVMAMSFNCEGVSQAQDWVTEKGEWFVKSEQQ